jgi:hypothetical protein
LVKGPPAAGSCDALRLRCHPPASRYSRCLVLAHNFGHGYTSPSTAVRSQAPLNVVRSRPASIRCKFPRLRLVKGPPGMSSFPRRSSPATKRGTRVATPPQWVAWSILCMPRLFAGRAASLVLHFPLFAGGSQLQRIPLPPQRLVSDVVHYLFVFVVSLTLERSSLAMTG